VKILELDDVVLDQARRVVVRDVSSLLDMVAS
jgi:hypothetical protein